jgi:hypothetical protein
VVLIVLLVVSTVVGALFSAFLGMNPESAALSGVIIGAWFLQAVSLFLGIVVVIRRRPTWWSAIYVGTLAFIFIVPFLGDAVYRSLRRLETLPTAPSTVEISRTTAGLLLSSPTELIGIAVGGPGLGLIGDWPNYGIWVSKDGIDWRGRGDFGELFYPKAIVPWGSGLAATGEVTGSGAIWTSSDGYTWNRIGGDRSIGDGAIHDLVEWQGAVLAVGSNDNRPTVMLSKDQVTWEVAQISDLIGGVMAVEAFEGQLVAVGYGSTAEVTASVERLIWTSNDGRKWTLAEDLDQLASQGSDRFLSDISVGPAGYFAVGKDQTKSQPTVLSSGDGFSWVPFDEGLPSTGWINAVAANLDTVVIVGGDGNAESTQGFILFSKDGAAWEYAETPPRIGELRALTYGQSGWLAVGAAFEGGCQCVVLSSGDGAMWSQLYP